MGIKRYGCGNGDGMFDDEEGYWVSYKDHNNIVKKLELDKKALTEQLALCGVSNALKAYVEWQDTTDIDLGAYTNEEQMKLYTDSFL